MYHSITFGEKDKLLAMLADRNDEAARAAWDASKRNTTDDWFLIPTSRPTFSTPGANTYLVEVPGANGSINLTKSMTGYTTYKNRTGAFDFAVMNDKWPNWVKAYHDIVAYLHGQELIAILEDDSSYYYDGVWSVSSFGSGANNSTVTINYSVQPFKKSLIDTNEDWLWDPFDFVTGYIQNSTKNLVVDGSLDVTIFCGDEPVSPKFDVAEGSSLQVSYEGKTYDLPAGKKTTMRKIKMAGGDRTLHFTGTGTVTIEYRSGWF